MIMAITKETVKYVAHLARIELKPKELEKLSGQLKEILDFIDKLKKVDTKKDDIKEILKDANNQAMFEERNNIDFFCIPIYLKEEIEKRVIENEK